MQKNDKEKLWVEKYRPTKIDGCILPESMKEIFRKHVADGFIPNMILEGPPGTGKTSVAKAMCAELGVDVYVINASGSERGIDFFKTTMVQYASTMSLTGKGKVILIDEGDGMTSDAQDAFRANVEKFSKTCSFIITCNYASKIKEAIQSRMPIVSFRFDKTVQLALQKQMFDRCCEILKDQAVPFEVKAVAQLVHRFYPDFRRTIGELQKFAKYGKIDISHVEQIGTAHEVTKFIDHIQAKNFKEARKWIADNDLDENLIYKKVYDLIYDRLVPESRPMAVVIIAKYQYQHGFTANPEINLAAFAAEVMASCDFI